jgi:hypothetical protein
MLHIEPAIIYISFYIIPNEVDDSNPFMPFSFSKQLQSQHQPSKNNQSRRSRPNQSKGSSRQQRTKIRTNPIHPRIISKQSSTNPPTFQKTRRRHRSQITRNQRHVNEDNRIIVITIRSFKWRNDHLRKTKPESRHVTSNYESRRTKSNWKKDRT